MMMMMMIIIIIIIMLLNLMMLVMLCGINGVRVMKFGMVLYRVAKRRDMSEMMVMGSAWKKWEMSEMIVMSAVVSEAHVMRIIMGLSIMRMIAKLMVLMSMPLKSGWQPQESKARNEKCKMQTGAGQPNFVSCSRLVVEFATNARRGRPDNPQQLASM